MPNSLSIRPWMYANEQHKTRPIFWSVFNHENQISTKFDFKSDALLFKKKLPHATLYFHWYEDEMSKLHWNVEPTETYAELCKHRAIELRETYDYLRLWYSGGADSHSALLSFVNNNIPLDEVVILLYPDKNVDDVTKCTANEVLIAAIPQLKQIVDKIPNTKITILEGTDKDLDQWFAPKSDVIQSAIDLVDGSADFFVDLAWGFPKILKNTFKKNFCDIHGGSKVKLFKNGRKWYSYFVDSSLPPFYIANHTEDFFISRTVPSLYLKTVYNLKNYHLARNSTDRQVNSMYNNPTRDMEYNFAMGRDLVHPIATVKLYSTSHNIEQWEKLGVSGAKGTLMYNNIISSNQGQKWYQNHLEKQNILIENFGDFWNKDANNNIVPYLGFSGHLSKFYCLNDGKHYDSKQAGFKNY